MPGQIDPVQAGALLAMVLLALAVAVAAHDRWTSWRYRCEDAPPRRKGWDGWEWDDATWDTCWPLSPGQRWLARQPPEGDVYLVPLVYGAALQDAVAEQDWMFLHGAGKRPPWRGFTIAE